MTDEAQRRLRAAKAKKTEGILNTAAASREKMIKGILDKIFRSEDEAVTRKLAERRLRAKD